MQLSSKQLDFIKHSHQDINIASGSIRSGKTHIQIYRWLYFLEEEAIKNVDCLITGKKADAVERNIIIPLLDIAEQESIIDRFHFTRSPRRLVYKPKNIICYCEGANDEGAEPRIRGMTIQAWLADEVTLYPKSFFLQAIGRCSAGKRFKFLTCNPDSPSHYISTEIIEKIQSKKINGKIWYFNLSDNPSLNPDYIEQIKNLYTGVFYERFIEGKWVLAEGVVYDLFNREKHLIKDYPKDQIMEYVIGIDWGYENPLALVLIGVTQDDQYYIVDEIYESHQLIDNSLLVTMKNRGWFDLKKYESPIPISYAYTDPARPDYVYQFYQLTKIATIPGSNDVNEGIQAVQRKFVIQKNKQSGIYIKETCTNVIKELESYKWKTNKDGQGKDEPVKENDHILDAIRYAIYTRERSRVKVIGNPFK